MAAVRRRAVYRRRVDAFAEYDDHDFFQRYRMTKQIARLICQSYTASGYGRKDGRGHAITDDLMVGSLYIGMLLLEKKNTLSLPPSKARFFIQ